MTTVVGVLVLVALAMWRLSLGPVDLDFLRPYAVRTVETPQGPVKLEVGRIALSWELGEGPMRLQLDDLKAVDTRGDTIARVPGASVDLQLSRLFTGTIAPTSIIVERVILDVVIDQEGLMRMLLPSADSDPSARFMPLLVEQLLKEPNDRDFFGRLNEVRINNAYLRIDDRASGFVWQAPAAGAVMLRDEVGVLVRTRTQLEAGEQVAIIDFNSVYSRDRERIRARLTVENLRPSLFAGASKELAALAFLDLPMSGNLELDASGSGVIRSIRLDLKGGAGKVTLPGLFSEPRAVTRVALRATAVPARRELNLESFDIDLDGPVASLTGKIQDRDSGFTATGTAELKEIPMWRMGEFWPPGYAPGGRAWSLANISGGKLDRASVSFGLRGKYEKAGAVEIDSIDANIVYSGLSVQYMQDMTPVVGVSGTGRFDGKVLRFEPKSGHSGGVSVPSARIDILGLDGEGVHRTEMTLNLVATAADAMTFMEQSRLGVPRDVLFNPDRLGGDVKVELKVALPLVTGVTLEQVRYSAAATLHRFSLARAIADFRLTEGEATLNVDPHELSIKGRAKVEGIPLDIAWKESFSAKAVPRRRYEVRTTVAIPALAKLGVVIPDKYATGTISAEAVYQSSVKGQADVTVRLGLGQTRLVVPELRWEKPAGQDGKLVLSTRFVGPTATAVEFDGAAGDLTVKGRVDLNATDGSWQQIALSRLTIGRTDMGATVRKDGALLLIDVKARALELERLQNAQGGGGGGGGGEGGPPARIAASFQIDQILMKRGALGPVNGSARLQGEKIESANVTVGVGTTLRITPVGRARQLNLVSTDLGALLRSAGWVDGFVGGKLEVEGLSADDRPGTPLSASVALKDFRLARVPAGRPIGDLNEVIDGLERLGNPLAPFSLLEMRVQRTGDVITINRARTNNGSVGLSLAGTINSATEALRLEGTGVPAYVVNSLLSHVPIIGDVLTGGTGKGIFSINFAIAGTIGSPKVSVNVASILAPGILRELFGTGDGGAVESENPGEKGRSSEPRNAGQTP